MVGSFLFTALLVVGVQDFYIERRFSSFQQCHTARAELIREMKQRNIIVRVPMCMRQKDDKRN
jgi:hypothetical protein